MTDASFSVHLTEVESVLDELSATHLEESFSGTSASYIQDAVSPRKLSDISPIKELDKSIIDEEEHLEMLLAKIGVEKTRKEMVLRMQIESVQSLQDIAGVSAQRPSSVTNENSLELDKTKAHEDEEKIEFTPALAPFLQNSVLLTFDLEEPQTVEAVVKRTDKNNKLDISVQKWKNVREKRHKQMLQSMPAKEQLSNFEKLLALPVYARRSCRKMIEHKYFDYFIMLMIALNCIFLAMENPKYPNSAAAQAVKATNPIFVWIFGIEAFLKIWALGRFGDKNSYFNDYANCLDFFIVVIGYLDLYGSQSGSDSELSGMSALRTFRVLRPLRTITRLQGLKIIMNALLASIPMLMNTLVVTLFLFLIFGIVGMQLWKGQLLQRCIVIETGAVNVTDMNGDRLCGGGRLCTNVALPQNLTNLGIKESQFCGIIEENPKHGVLSFDNILYAFLNIFMAITLEGWSEQMYAVMDVDSSGGSLAVIFYIILILFGSFIMINLTLAVIMSKFRAQWNVSVEKVQKKLEEIAMNKIRSAEGPAGGRRSSYMNLLEEQTLEEVKKGSHRYEKFVSAEERVHERERKKTIADIRKLIDIGNSDKSFAFKSARPAAISENAESRLPTRSQSTPDMKKGHSPNRIRSSRRGSLDSTTSEIRSRADSADVRELMQAVEEDTKMSFEHRIREFIRGRYWLNRCLVAANILTDPAVPKTATLPPFMWAKWLRSQVETSWCDRFMYSCIILNALVIATYHPHQDENEWMWSTIANYAFTWIFAIEMVVKIAAYNFPIYVADRFNVFDFIIANVGIVEFFVDILASQGQNSSSPGELNLSLFQIIRVFRLFRVMRVIKLVRHLGSLKMIVEVITNSISSFGYILFLLFIFMFIYSVLGVQLFSDKLNHVGFDGANPPRNNFDDLLTAFITVFQVLTGENWNYALYEAARGAGTFPAAIFYLSWVVLGQFILLNLFLAVLLDQFGRKNEEKRLNDERKAKRKSEAKRVAVIQSSIVGHLFSKSLRKMKDKEPQSPAPTPAVKLAQKLNGKSKIELVRFTDSPTSSGMSTPRSSPSPSPTNLDDIAIDENGWSNTWRERSLFLFGPKNPFRKMTEKIESWKYFEYFILSLIILSSFALAAEEPGIEKRNPQLKHGLDIADYIFTAIFTIEVIIKVINAGFLFQVKRDKTAYILVGWNVLDFVVVVTGIANIILARMSSNDELGVMKSLRLFRCFRPLRVIARNEGMKRVVETLFTSLGAIGNVMAILFIIWFMFAIFGVQMFGGLFADCNDPNFGENRYRYGSYNYSSQSWIYTPCNASFNFTDKNGNIVPREWVNADNNFDDLFQALLTLFVVASLEGFPDIMYRACDTTYPNFSPKRDNTQWSFLYFFAFVISGSFLSINLIVGVIFSQYKKLKDKNEMPNLLKDQQKWLRNHMSISRVRPRKILDPPVEPKEDTKPIWKKIWRLRFSIYNQVMAPYFERGIMMVIVINTLAMAMDYHGMSADYEEVLLWINQACAIIFFIEMCLKFLGLGIQQYFSDWWNCVDFVIVLLSIFEGVLLILTRLKLLEGGMGFNTSVFRTFRVMRVTRMFRLVKFLQGLQTIKETLIASIPPLINVSGLLILIFFIFAIMMMNFIGDLEINYEGGGIREHANFSNVFISLLTLFRMSTGEGWNEIMNDAMRANWLYALLFVAFITTSTFVMLNMFIMIILDNYDNAEEMTTMEFNKEHLEEFLDAWVFYDPKGTMFIDTDDFVDLFKHLDEPLGFGSKGTFKSILEAVNNMGIIDWEGRVHFKDVLLGLHANRFGNNVHKKIDEKTLKKAKVSFNDLRKSIAHGFEKTHPRIHDDPYKFTLARTLALARLREPMLNLLDKIRVRIRNKERSRQINLQRQKEIKALKESVKHIKIK